MKKDLLFVMPSLSAGGGEKSLVSLLSQIDYRYYKVDLFLFNQEGLFMEYLPKEVNILPLPIKYKIFTLPLFQATMKLILKGNIQLAFDRFIFTLINRLITNIAVKEQRSWRYIRDSLNPLVKDYDIAIGFLEKTSTYFCVDKVKARKKLGWVHVDYDNLGMNPYFDLKYFKQLDHIITVSEECAKILENRFPSEKDKIEIIYNIVSPTMINKMANYGPDNVYNKQADEITVLSIGRLHYQKNFELAIYACKALVEKGYNIKWNIIGEGDEREKLENFIKEYKLEKNFTLLGLKSNPYPYLKEADIYVQTSRFEGKSIAIDEAKVLNKPIIVTNFNTAKDQINDKVDGLIVEMEIEALVQGIEMVITNESLRKSLTENLSRLNLGTESEVNKLYKLCN